MRHVRRHSQSFCDDLDERLLIYLISTEPSSSRCFWQPVALKNILYNLSRKILKFFAENVQIFLAGNVTIYTGEQPCPTKREERPAPEGRAVKF